jgi:hypothetical protein
VRTGRAVALFITGFLLAASAFPIAFYVSAAVGYALCLAAIGLGVYMIAKRGDRVLPLVLGIILAILGAGVFGGTLFVHLTTYSINKGIEEAMKTKFITASIGETITVDDWRITVTNVREARFVRLNNDFYTTKNNDTKIVIVTLRIENIGNETRSLSDIWEFTLTTNANKSYERAYTIDLEYLWNPSKEATSSAVAIESLDMTGSLAPGTHTEGDILFVVPRDEAPAKLYFKVGVLKLFEVEVKLG